MKHIDLLIAAAVAFALAAANCRSFGWLGWAAFGVVLFGFIEYVVHRWLLHGPFWSNHHERHHTHPSEHVVFPVYLLPAIFAGFFVALPIPVFAGFLLGYAWFSAWHGALHHWNLETHPLIRRYADWHLVHHMGQPMNFGISHPLFDIIFRTYRTAEEAAAIARAQRRT